MTSLNVPNSITNGTVADATDVQQNFDAIESHVNAEVINRDGSIAMTGELLLPSNPTSNLAASTKAYVDGKDTAMDTRVTALEGTDIDITLTGDVTGTGTITNLGDVSFVTTVVDDLHDHTVANVDGLQADLDAKLASNASFGGDVSGTYDNLTVTDSSHAHGAVTRIFVQSTTPTGTVSTNDLWIDT